MPEDKDFKRIVRARMEETGEPYTKARSELRPDAGADRSAIDAAAFPAEIVPLDLEQLLARAPQMRPPRPGDPFVLIEPPTGEPAPGEGRRWELAIEAGGSVDAIDRAVVSLDAVARLGASLAGVPYIIFGVDVLIPAPPGVEPGDTRPPSPQVRQPVFAAMSEVGHRLEQVLRDSFGFDPAELGRRRRPAAFVTGRPTLLDGTLVFPGRTRLAVYVDEKAIAALGRTAVDPFAWASDGDPLPGKLWAGFGLVVDIIATFPIRPAPEAARAMPDRPPFPNVSDTFWTSIGQAFLNTAADVGLPGWPLLHASLTDHATRAEVSRDWQPSWRD